jgi:hypothetical protein
VSLGSKIVQTTRYETNQLSLSSTIMETPPQTNRNKQNPTKDNKNQ